MQKFQGKVFVQDPPAITVIQEFLQLIDQTVEKSSETGNVPFASAQTLASLRVTLSSTLDVVHYLHSLGYKYVLTAKLNQDCLERFFGLIRGSGGSNDHPTVPNFLFLYRLLSLYSPVKNAIRGNVEHCSDEFILSCLGDCFKSKDGANTKQDSLQTIANMLEAEEMEDGCPWNEHTYSAATIEDCIVHQFGGYVARKMMKTPKCHACIDTLLVDKADSVKEAQLTLCKDRGGLLYCSPNLFSLLIKVDSHLKRYVKLEKIHGALFWEITENIGSVGPLKVGRLEHSTVLTAMIIHFYVYCHMHYLLKQINLTLRTRQVKNCRKKAKVL